MDPSTFGIADHFVDEIADAVDAVLISDQLAEVRKALAELGKATR